MTSPTTLAATCAIIALAASVGGCGQRGASAGRAMTVSSNSACIPFRAAPSAPAVIDPSVAIGECTHRWGYALAPARDSAEIVAQAVVDACAADLSRWNQQAVNQSPQASTYGAAPPTGSEMATSLTTGQPIDAMTAHAQYAQSRALFYVVQARAGNCAGPPASEMTQAAAPGS